MRRIFFIAILTVFMVDSLVYAAGLGVFDSRNKIFDEANKIKSTLVESKDALLMMTMWDTCLIAVKQVDAYYYMVRIFNTIKPEDVTEEAIDSLTDWLDNIKKTNDLNVDGLNKMTENKAAIDAATLTHIDSLKVYFKELNDNIDNEAQRIKAAKKPL